MIKALVLSLVALIASVGAAQTVAVTTVRSGGLLSPDERTEILTGALDEFFMEGFIVTSTESQASGDGAWPDPGLASAREGFVDYLLALEPFASPGGGAQSELAGLRYSLLSVADGLTLTEGRIEAKRPGLPSLAERNRVFRTLGSEAAQASMQAARNRFTGGWQ